MEKIPPTQQIFLCCLSSWAGRKRGLLFFNHAASLFCAHLMSHICGISVNRFNAKNQRISCFTQMSFFFYFFIPLWVILLVLFTQPGISFVKLRWISCFVVDIYEWHATCASHLKEPFLMLTFWCLSWWEQLRHNQFNHLYHIHFDCNAIEIFFKFPNSLISLKPDFLWKDVSC